jgi:hypothetical protein
MRKRWGESGTWFLLRGREEAGGREMELQPRVLSEFYPTTDMDKALVPFQLTHQLKLLSHPSYHTAAPTVQVRTRIRRIVPICYTVMP